MGHAFFGASLAVFLCYLIRKKLTGGRGWLYIAISACALILWNIFSILGLHNLNGPVLAASAFFLYLGIRWHWKTLEEEVRD